MELSDFIDQSNKLDAPEDIVALMEHAAADIGFDRYAYCSLTRHSLYNAGDNPAPLVVHNFPATWINHYFENEYQTKDPVVLYAPHIERPFLWNQLGSMVELKQAHRTVMRQAAEARLRDGIGIPIHEPHGNASLMTFAASDGHTNPVGQLSTLTALAAQFHLAYSKIARTDVQSKFVPILTERERECLMWIGFGKSTWEIGQILEISENTAKDYVKRASAKLNTHTRTQAVIAAVRSGQISLAQFYST